MSEGKMLGSEMDEHSGYREYELSQLMNLQKFFT